MTARNLGTMTRPTPKQLLTLALAVVDPITPWAPVHILSGKNAGTATVRRLVADGLLVERDHLLTASIKGIEAVRLADEEGRLPDGVLEEQILALAKRGLQSR